MVSFRNGPKVEYVLSKWARKKNKWEEESRSDRKNLQIGKIRLQMSDKKREEGKWGARIWSKENSWDG